jgi:major membrane immunogen (membrane-anchored lipoprotein)
MKYAIAMLLSATLLGACSSNHKAKQTRAEMTQIMKQQNAENLVNNLFTSVDKREWKELGRNFASRSVVIVEGGGTPSLGSSL